MDDLADRIKKLILFEKQTIYRDKSMERHQWGRVSAFRDVLNMLGENPYFEVHEQAQSLATTVKKNE